MTESDLPSPNLPDADLVELERELETLLLEYERLREAWPKERDVLRRVEIGHRVHATLRRVHEIRDIIAKAPARSLADAAV